MTLEDYSYRCPQIDLTIDREFALMTDDDRFDDRQSQTRATANIRIISCPRRIDPIKPVEQMWDCFTRNAHSRILDFDLEIRRILPNYLLELDINL